MKLPGSRRHERSCRTRSVERCYPDIGGVGEVCDDERGMSVRRPDTDVKQCVDRAGKALRKTDQLAGRSTSIPALGYDATRPTNVAAVDLDIDHVAAVGGPPRGLNTSGASVESRQRV